MHLFQQRNDNPHNKPQRRLKALRRLSPPHSPILTNPGTRKFCLDYHLPICRGASNDPTHGDDTVINDISTICFRTPCPRKVC